MPYGLKSYFKDYTASAFSRFVEDFGWQYQYPTTQKPYGESAAKEWEPFNQFRAYYILTVPTSPPIYNINYNPLVNTYNRMGRIYFFYRNTVFYKQDIIYQQATINNLSYFNVSPNENPLLDFYLGDNPVSRIAVELFKPGITLRLGFNKPFYYENASPTP